MPIRSISSALLLMLSLLFMVWTWKQGSQHWPRIWGALRALFLGALLWWIAERTRESWKEGWQILTRDDVLNLALPDLALFAGLTPPLL